MGTPGVSGEKRTSLCEGGKKASAWAMGQLGGSRVWAELGDRGQREAGTTRDDGERWGRDIWILQRMGEATCVEWPADICRRGKLRNQKDWEEKKYKRMSGTETRQGTQEPQGEGRFEQRSSGAQGEHRK